jgi:hypothetical protein
MIPAETQPGGPRPVCQHGVALVHYCVRCEQSARQAFGGVLPAGVDPSTFRDLPGGVDPAPGLAVGSSAPGQSVDQAPAAVGVVDCGQAFDVDVDGLAATVDWAIECGFVRVAGGEQRGTYRLERGGFRVDLWFGLSLATLSVNGCLVCEYPTRGDVRRLFAGLKTSLAPVTP